jgi:hypothetical protein
MELELSSVCRVVSFSPKFQTGDKERERERKEY